jgi:hypothetical protein
VTSVAFGKQRLAIRFILPAISRVISSTLFLSLRGNRLSISITFSDDVPATIATIVPFFPLAALLVKTV